MCIDSFVGFMAQVHGSLVGKYGIVFSTSRSLSVAHLARNFGQKRDLLAWVELGLHEMHLGILAAGHVAMVWDSLEQLAHFSILLHVARMWSYS